MKKTMVTVALFAVTMLNSGVFAKDKTIVETAIEAGNFKTLVTAVQAAGLVDTLSGHDQFTVFAPTDEAFAKLDSETLENLLKPENKDQLAGILTYHVLPGQVAARDAYDLSSAQTANGQRLPIDFRGNSLTVGESKITFTDIQCSNGVIHVIDSVLLPKLDSIPATAKAAGQFNTLLAAVEAADLASVLSGPGPFTVFAPTDEAFDKLPAGTVESLLQAENKQKLTDILKYHVISGRVYDDDAVKAGSAKTLLGRGIDISLSADGVRINDALLRKKNIETSNGVVHVIDSVLIPTSISWTTVMSSVTDAINEGAPIFNAGHHARCCDIYMETMEIISAAGIENADAGTMTMIDQTLAKARETHCDTARAWVLRRGLDSLYSRMSNMSEAMSMQTLTSR